jgi:hypothetical protein
MSRILALTVSVLALAAAGLATAAQARAEDEGTIYQRYADIRERLYACHLEGKDGWDTQTDDRKADCRRLTRYYVLYGWTGEGFSLHVHCRTPQHCIPTPSSEPPADQPMPAGSTVYDIKIAREAAHKKKAKRRHRKKARARRSRAAHGSAAATR